VFKRLEQCPDIDVLGEKLDASGPDTGEVEEVINETRHLSNLPINDAAGGLLLRPISLQPQQQLD
jgi:hypothetical protein